MAAAKDGEKPKAAKGPYDAVDGELAADDDEDAVLEFTDEEIERMVAEDEEATEREVSWTAVSILPLCPFSRVLLQKSVMMD